LISVVNVGIEGGASLPRVKYIIQYHPFFQLNLYRNKVLSNFIFDNWNPKKYYQIHETKIKANK